jgi:uncharacterized membrane protein YjgN (DUF898 family)
MNATVTPASRQIGLLRFGILAILASTVIATMIATGLAQPWPNLKVAYFTCVMVGFLGAVVLTIVATRGRQT